MNPSWEIQTSLETSTLLKKHDYWLHIVPKNWNNCYLSNWVLCASKIFKWYFSPFKIGIKMWFSKIKILAAKKNLETHPFISCQGIFHFHTQVCGKKASVEQSLSLLQYKQWTTYEIGFFEEEKLALTDKTIGAHLLHINYFLTQLFAHFWGETTNLGKKHKHYCPRKKMLLLVEMLYSLFNVSF